MFKLYNTQSEIANDIRTFLQKNTTSLHKPQLNFLPEVLFGMILSESSVASDISKSLKENFSLVQHTSTIKRIHRLFNNPRYEGRELFNEIVKYIISNYKFSHNDKRVHIIIDHMYSKDNYTVLLLSTLIFDDKEGHRIRKQTGDLFSYQFHSVFYENVILYDNNSITTSIVRSKRSGVKEAWILATNKEPKRAIKDYGYRFGGIETVFKNQKSNGFYLEDICCASLKYFENLYATICISILLLTSIGTHYANRKRDYKNIKIETHKNYKNKGKIRIMSIFNTGLTLFKLAFNSYKKINLRLNFIIYDV